MKIIYFELSFPQQILLGPSFALVDLSFGVLGMAAIALFGVLGMAAIFSVITSLIELQPAPSRGLCSRWD